ncbi:MAG: hypothetical protein ACT4PY_04315 [Armatimonadota bacterium]
MKTLMGAIMLAIISVAAPLAEAQDGTPVPFETIATGRQTRVREATRVAIRDQAAWIALWTRHAGAGAAAPQVDFAREMVVAIFAGEAQVPRTLSIRRITRDPGGLAVAYSLGDARPILETDGLPRSNAFAIVRLVASPLPVRFIQVKTAPVVRSP